MDNTFFLFFVGLVGWLIDWGAHPVVYQPKGTNPFWYCQNIFLAGFVQSLVDCWYQFDVLVLLNYGCVDVACASDATNLTFWLFCFQNYGCVDVACASDA